MNDLIDRQAVLDIFKPWLDVKGYSEGELNMLRAVIYELETMPSTSAWVSVKDRLPETCDNVIVCNESGRVYSAWYNYGDNSWLYAFTAEIVTHEVTHWMPFPQKPESEDYDK